MKRHYAYLNLGFGWLPKWQGETLATVADKFSSLVTPNEDFMLLFIFWRVSDGLCNKKVQNELADKSASVICHTGQNGT